MIISFGAIQEFDKDLETWSTVQDIDVGSSQYSTVIYMLRVHSQCIAVVFATCSNFSSASYCCASPFFDSLIRSRHSCADIDSPSLPCNKKLLSLLRESPVNY